MPHVKVVPFTAARDARSAARRCCRHYLFGDETPDASVLINTPSHFLDVTTDVFWMA